MSHFRVSPRSCLWNCWSFNETFPTEITSVSKITTSRAREIRVSLLFSSFFHGAVRFRRTELLFAREGLSEVKFQRMCSILERVYGRELLEIYVTRDSFSCLTVVKDCFSCGKRSEDEYISPRLYEIE